VLLSPGLSHGFIGIVWGVYFSHPSWVDICCIPGEKDVVSYAEHDEIFLDIKPEQLAKVATEEQIKDLVTCGVRINKEYDCLAMFV